VKALTTRLWEYRHGLKARSVDMVIVVSGIGVVKIFAFLTAILVARFAGAATFGEYSLFMTVFVLVSEMPTALDVAFIRQVDVPGKQSADTESVVLLFISKMFFAIFLCGLGYFGSDFIANYVFEKKQTASILNFGINAGALYGINTTIVSLYQKRKQFIVMSFIRVLPNILFAVAVATFIGTEISLTLYNVGNIYLLVSVFLTLGTIMFLAKKLWSSWNNSFRKLPNFYMVGGIFILANVLINLTSRLDVFFLTPFLSFYELGIYGAATRYTVIAGIITGTITTIMLPKAPLALSDKLYFDKYLREAIAYMVLQSIFIFVLILFMDPFVHILFGNEYMNMKWIAIILFGQVFFTACGVPFQALLQCSKNVSVVLYLSMARLFLTLFLLKILVPSYGVVGGAIAMAGSACLLSIAMIILGWKICRPSKPRVCPVTFRQSLV